ncbi:hypothetical protein NPIL_355231 [Nephila pilipes]|uniref:Uncharacterized protein n=1 Tax=Nephila pilipes TaxID=299642 RepID=A0A8X6QM82_NEPPI|nr:hypothetical protein NPIL_355231 [Nephila pilipes]
MMYVKSVQSQSPPVGMFGDGEGFYGTQISFLKVEKMLCILKAMDEDPERYYVPTLQQIALAKIAIGICYDPEFKAFAQEFEFVKFGLSGSFMPPKKTPSLFLQGVNGLKKIKKRITDYVAKARARTTAESVQRNSIEAFLSKDSELKPIWEKLIEKKMSEVALPKHLQDDLLTAVTGIIWDIFRWTKASFDIIPSEEELLNNLSWKSDGEINFMKTANSLLDEFVIGKIKESLPPRESDDQEATFKSGVQLWTMIVK